ncbi:MAG: hypothetical protein PHY39_03315 [Endomicrobiaceae bacterium]|nr:hypothetical protein [Endomicrobiaceae bacterium]
MQNKIKNIIDDSIKQSNIKFLTKEEINAYYLYKKYNIGQTPHDFCTIFNGIGLILKTYHEQLRKITNILYKNNILYSYTNLDFYFSLIIFNRILEKSNSCDNSDTEFLSHFDFPSTSFDILNAKLTELYMDRYDRLEPVYVNQDAYIFSIYGVQRRLKLLLKNLESINSICNIKRITQLTDNENDILDIHINFIYPNISAILDCLAFFIQYQSNILVHFDKNNSDHFKKVNLFSEKFLEKIPQLVHFINWNNELKNKLRHPISHRIPFYNPKTLSEDEMKKEYELDSEIRKITIGGYKTEEYLRLREEQKQATNISDITYTKKKIDDYVNNNIDIKCDKIREKINNIGVFSGLFTNNENNQYHISRILLDIEKLIFVINLVTNLYTNKK